MSRKKANKKKKKRVKFSLIEKQIMKLALKGKELDQIMDELNLDIVTASEALFKIRDEFNMEVKEEHYES